MAKQIVINVNGKQLDIHVDGEFSDILEIIMALNMASMIVQQKTVEESKPNIILPGMMAPQGIGGIGRR